VLSRERRLFFLRWLNNPLRVGVPVPSSLGLGRAMAAQLSSILPNEYVVELGPGTGVVTRALLTAGISEKQLIVIEREPGFIDKLKHDFPHVTILQGDARNMSELLHQRGIKQIAAVISSLPLLSMPDVVRHAIVHKAFDIIKPNGLFIQYTYGLLSPVPVSHQRSIGIHGRIAKRVWRNFPPARVWSYSTEKAV